ncbi:MAG TPA: ferritin family protein [Candidatus Wunengus californicus]|uniref:ferritin family protein n=1 Tax=Candidatus Wunengus californicus TaxID=3367619 RepID=UPI0040273254
MKNNVMNSNKANDLKILEQSLALEIEATRRYQEQHDIVKDPEIHTLLEGLHRNEVDHEKIIRGHIIRLIGSGSDKIGDK